jgi:hypothetical protein
VLRILQEIHTDITKINAKLNELIHREWIPEEPAEAQAFRHRILWTAWNEGRPESARVAGFSLGFQSFSYKTHALLSGPLALQNGDLYVRGQSQQNGLGKLVEPWRFGYSHKDRFSFQVS